MCTLTEEDNSNFLQNAFEEFSEGDACVNRYKKIPKWSVPTHRVNFVCKCQLNYVQLIKFRRQISSVRLSFVRPAQYFGFAVRP